MTRQSLVRGDAVKASAEPDGAVLCAAVGGLDQWVEGWDKRTIFVFDDAVLAADFPLTKEQAPLAAVGDPRYDPLQPPALGKDLDLNEGPVVPAALVSSAITRSKAVKVLPPPDCENVIVADGNKLNRLWEPDVLAGWRRFWALFPETDGVVQCSAPGYNTAQTIAIVSCWHTTAALNGVGVFFMLESVGHIWHVTWSRSMWVS